MPLRKGLDVLLSLVERVFARVAVGSALVTLASTPAKAQPVVPVGELTVTTAEVRKYSAKYILKQARNGIVHLMQHRSHASHASHASHYSGSTGGNAPPPANPPPKPAPNPQPAKISEQPADTSAISDDFNDNQRNSTKWRLGVAATDTATFDTLVKVAQQDQQLVIVPAAKKTGQRFNGYVSADQVTLTNSSAEVELVQPPADSAVAIFAVVKDSDNLYGFRVADGMLTFETRVGGKKSEKTVLYDSRAHRHLRLMHDSAMQMIVWQTSRDGVRWSTVHSDVPTIELTDMTIALSAGTERAVPEPGKAIFDNFAYRHR